MKSVDVQAMPPLSLGEFDHLASGAFNAYSSPEMLPRLAAQIMCILLSSALSPFPASNAELYLQLDSDFSPNVNQANANPIPPHNHDSDRHLVDNSPIVPDAVAVAPARDTRPESAQEPVKSAVDLPAVDVAYKIPETIMLSHAPGWTVFRNLYMSNGTLYVVTSRPKSFPEIVMITSTGLAADASPENIQARIPTEKDMSFLTPEEAHDLWGGDIENVRVRFSLGVKTV